MNARCPTGQCRKNARCLECIERDAKTQEGMTKQNSPSILRSLFGLRGRRK